MERNLSQIQKLKHVGIAHFILESDTQKVKVLNGILRLQGKQRDLFFPHNLIQIHPRGVDTLTIDVLSFVKHIVENLDSQMGHTQLVDIRESHGKADLSCRILFHHIHFPADVTGRLLNA